VYRLTVVRVLTGAARRWLTSESGRAYGRAAVHVYAALVLFFVCYRVRLWHAVAVAVDPPITAKVRPLYFYLATTANDLWVAAVIALPLAALLGWVQATGRTPRIAHLTTGVLLASVGVITVTHFNLLFTMNAGLSYYMLLEALSSLSSEELVTYTGVHDWLMAALPPFAWVSMRRLSGRALVARDAALVLVLAVIVSCSLVVSGKRRAANPIRRSPPAYFVGDLISTLFASDAFAGRAAAVSDAQLGSLRLVDPEFLDAGAPAPASPRPPLGREVNLLLVILESVGTSYVFTPGVDHPAPMPYLTSLRDRGWYFASHTSTANTSPRAVFSIMSGLYPEQEPTIYCGRKDIALPGLGSYLRATHESFFVTPGRLRSYFPKGFMSSSGIGLYGFESPELEGIPVRQANGRDEVKTVDFFLEKLRQARPPFFATYYSYAPHYNYLDYGEPYRITRTKTPRERYLNGLRLLDSQLQRMVEELERLGRAADTMIIVVGDHGEAFGQHEGNVTHSRYSYEENLRTPLIIYFPKGLEPRRIDTRTTHADIAPTVLDMLGKDYDPKLVQGESWWRGDAAQRRYVFAIGNENVHTSISREGIKLHVQAERGRCWTHDLVADPNELQKLPCDGHSAQLDALLKFKTFQSAALRARNEVLKEQKKTVLTRHTPD
jgi:phosphoglycerol transferase MdoB-like AlkP superfamily enzyme